MHDHDHHLRERALRFGGGLEVVRDSAGEQPLQRAGEVRHRDVRRIERQLIGIRAVRRAEEEVVALFGARAQVVDRWPELVDVGLEHVEEVVAFGLLVDGEEEPGLSFDEVGEAGERDRRALEVVLGVVDDVSEVGLADGCEGDSEEVYLAVLDALEQEGEGAGELGALDVDLGRLCEAEGSDLLSLCDLGGLVGQVGGVYFVEIGG